MSQLSYCKDITVALASMPVFSSKDVHFELFRLAK
jgi:hypothetical protein